MLALCLSACSSTDPGPKSLKEDADFISTIGEDRLENRIYLAPITANYQATELTEEPIVPDLAEINSQSESGALPTLAYYQPMLTEAELKTLTEESKAWFSYLFEKDSVRTVSLQGLRQYKDEDLEAMTAAERVKALCQEAENRGGEIVAVTEFLQNKLSYIGPDQGSISLDLWMTFFFFPLNGYVNDELFEIRRSARVSLYDVREPGKALHSYTVESVYEMSLEEWQHGYVFLNGYKAWRGEPIENRFENDNWQRVHSLMEPYGARAFEKQFIQELRTTVRDIFSRQEVQEKLRDGHPDQARLYALCIGQNLGKTRFAEADAQAMHHFLIEKSGVLPTHASLLTGEVTKDAILEKIDALSIKSVDRIFFYFAGQGAQTDREQWLVLKKGRISLTELSRALRKRTVDKLAFVLDTSFGSPKRSELYGGRTHKSSLAALPLSRQEDYLKPLVHSLRWRVLCAAPSDGVASELEDRGHGLLTYLILEQLSKTKSVPSFDEIESAIEGRYRKISQSVMGSPYKPVALARPAARGFKLVSRR